MSRFIGSDKSLDREDTVKMLYSPIVEERCGNCRDHHCRNEKGWRAVLDWILCRLAVSG